MPGVNVDLNFVSVRSVPPYEGEPRRIDTSTPVVVVGMVGVGGGAMVVHCHRDGDGQRPGAGEGRGPPVLRSPAPDGGAARPPSSDLVNEHSGWQAVPSEVRRSNLVILLLLPASKHSSQPVLSCLVGVVCRDARFQHHLPGVLPRRPSPPPPVFLLLSPSVSTSSSLSLSRQESWCSCEHLQNIWYSGERFTAAMASVLFLCLLAQASGHWFTCQASKH